MPPQCGVEREEGFCGLRCPHTPKCQLSCQLTPRHDFDILAYRSLSPAYVWAPDLFAIFSPSCPLPPLPFSFSLDWTVLALAGRSSLDASVWRPFLPSRYHRAYARAQRTDERTPHLPLLPSNATAAAAATRPLATPTHTHTYTHTQLLQTAPPRAIDRIHGGESKSERATETRSGFLIGLGDASNCFVCGCPQEPPLVDSYPLLSPLTPDPPWLPVSPCAARVQPQPALLCTRKRRKGKKRMGLSISSIWDRMFGKVCVSSPLSLSVSVSFSPRSLWLISLSLSLSLSPPFRPSAAL